MASKRRVWEPHAIYHVTTRGNRKEEIFRDEQDFRVYLRILEDTIIYYSYLNYQILTYCLMSNHVHLLIKTDSEPLKRFMARLNSMYTKYFNKKYGYIGHLFQSKYFSEIIKDDAHLLQVSKYVHLNPVKAKIVEEPDQYKWSSYLMITGKIKPELVNIDIVLDYFKYDNRFESYMNFIAVPPRSNLLDL